jgi:hypothetical protein
MTVEEMLRQAGLNDDEIKALDQRATTAFNSALTQAETLRSDAQEAERRYQHLYTNEMVPALNKWGTDAAQKDAEIAFYRAQLEGARTAGFIPKDAPGYAPAAAAPQPHDQPTRGPDGRYLPGGNPVPGSPGPGAGGGGRNDYTLAQIMKGISDSQWYANEYGRLYGGPPPDDFDALMQQADGKMQLFRDYVSQKYNFEGKRKELAETKAREHDDSIRKDERQKIEKEYAERGGSNPMLRAATSSNFATVRKAMESGRAKDPLTLNAEQRRMQTREMISTDRAAHDSQGTA